MATLKKWQRVLSALAEGRSFNRFEAERELHDHCLHSTVSRIQEMGVQVNRRMETVSGYQGLPTIVARYWISPELHQKAREVAGNSQSRRVVETGCQKLPPELAGFGLP